MKTKLNLLALNVKAALVTAAWVALGPVNRYAERNLCLYDITPDDIKGIEKSVTEKFNELKSAMSKVQDTAQKALDENSKLNTIEAKTSKELADHIATATKVQTETKAAVDTAMARVLEVEQKLAARAKTDEDQAKQQKTVGQQFVESAEFKDMIGRKSTRSAPMSFERKTIFNASTLDGNQPLVVAQRLPGIIQPVNRRLTIRDLCPQLPTSSDLVQYAKEASFTNNAGPQGGLTSPTVTGGEGEIKPESQLTFTLSSAAVITLAHFIGASRQVLNDAPQLAAYIDSRLSYGLKLEEELELLVGTGIAGKLNGINNQAVAFSYGSSGSQQLDVLLYAILQISLTNLQATGFVLHPVDWVAIQKLKDTTGRYLFSNPHDTEIPRVWGVPVVPTQSQALGQFTAGAFDMGCAIYDREGMNIRISDEHADFFTRNLVAILCEERLAFAMYRPEAFVYGAIGSGAGY